MNKATCFTIIVAACMVGVSGCGSKTDAIVTQVQSQVRDELKGAKSISFIHHDVVMHDASKEVKAMAVCGTVSVEDRTGHHERRYIGEAAIGSKDGQDVSGLYATEIEEGINDRFFNAYWDGLCSKQTK